jgi:4-hydroxy-tetrahydrodipicolinate synthase
MLPDGIFAACLTPLKPNLDVDDKALLRHCQWLLANGCDGLAPLGSTGEANSFSVSERKKLLDVLIEGGLQPERLLVGTGCCAIPDACDLTRHAIAHGVGGVLMLPPFFYKGVSNEGVFRYYDQVIQKAGESRLRIYLYHFPKMTGVPIDEPLIERLIKAYPRTVVGMKDSGGDWNHMKLICQRFPGFRVYAGSEQFLLDILKIGGVGCISASTNITCTLASKVFRAWRSNNATELQDALNRVRGVIEKYPLIPGLKQLMANATGNHDWLNMRPPFAALSDNDASKIDKSLEELGFALPPCFNV